MITIPKKLFYAIEAVLYIAYNSQEGPISSKEIAEHQELPPRYLEQLMQKLVRANILKGVRGPRGGYQLAKERRRITIADLSEILLEGDEDSPETATRIGSAVVLPLWQEVREELMQKMQTVTIADLCAKAHSMEVPKNTAITADFSI